MGPCGGFGRRWRSTRCHQAFMLGDSSLSWTTFYLACLTGKDAVMHSEVKAVFRIVGSGSRPCWYLTPFVYYRRSSRVFLLPNIGRADNEAAFYAAHPRLHWPYAVGLLNGSPHGDCQWNFHHGRRVAKEAIGGLWKGTKQCCLRVDGHIAKPLHIDRKVVAVVATNLIRMDRGDYNTAA